MFYILGALLVNLFDGSHVSDCPLPCKTTQTQTKLLYESKGDGSWIDINFSSKVKVTKTDLEKPTLSSFLSEVKLKTCVFAIFSFFLQVGGSAGLWLGLGAVQVFQLSVNCLLFVVRKYKGN